MKKILVLLFVALFLACNSDSFNNHNPYIPNFPFQTQIDMALPAYSQLQFPSNAVYYNDGNSGVRGLIIFNTGSSYNAFDAACPNQDLGSCSTMSINGIYAHCNCDEADYSLFTGQTSSAGHPYPMKQYRVSRNGTLLTIYN
jgi:nitrite reductase/ring-hydroxylating ferredoxin subunit